MIDSGTIDNCFLDTMYLDQYGFNCNDQPSTTVTLFAEDYSGNQAQVTATVFVEDTIAPLVQTQDIFIYLDSLGIAMLDPEQINDGTSDNCLLDSLWLSDTLFDCSDTNTIHTVTLFAQDSAGNVSQATASVEVFDTLDPITIAHDITVYLDSNGDASITPSNVDSGSNDNCAIAGQIISQSTFTCSEAETTFMLALQSIDISGNASIDSFEITVSDTIGPFISTQDITLALDSDGVAEIDTSSINLVSWDACGIDTMFLNIYDFDCADIGLNTVILTAVDIHGNTHQDSAIVEIIDTIAPIILWQNVNVYLDSFGSATIAADTFDTGSWDNCVIDSISIDVSQFTCADHGDTIDITFTAVDFEGNTSTATVQAYVFDTLAPIVYATNETVYLDSFGQFTLDYQVVDSGSYDNCGIASMYLNDSLFDCSDTDSSAFTWLVVVDTFGNI